MHDTEPTNHFVAAADPRTHIPIVPPRNEKTTNNKYNLKDLTLWETPRNL